MFIKIKKITKVKKKNNEIINVCVVGIKAHDKAAVSTKAFILKGNLTQKDVLREVSKKIKLESVPNPKSNIKLNLNPQKPPKFTKPPKRKKIKSKYRGPKIVGIFGTGTQSRFFESFPKVRGMTIYGPSPSKPIDYSSNIRNFKNAFKPLPQKWPKVIAKQLNKLGPIDVLFTGFGGDVPKQINAKYRVILAHGEMGKNIAKISPKTQHSYDVAQEYWGGYDLICGGMETIKKYIVDDLHVKDSKFLFNALPQYDLVYKNNNLDLNKTILFRHLGKKYEEVIMFIGFCCRSAVHFVPNNEDYFRALRVLMDYAKANPNSLIITKSRKPIEAMEEWLERYRDTWDGWTEKYFNILKEAQRQKNIHWMDGKIPLYPYFFCDKIVINASSTLEIEGLLSSKPVIVFKSKYCPLEDGFDTAEMGAAELVRNEVELKHALYNYNQIDLSARDKWMEKFGITYDGLHSQRIIDVLNLN